MRRCRMSSPTRTSVTYTFWWGMDALMAPAESNRLWRRVVSETTVAQPRRGKTRFLMLYCAAVVVIIGGTTSFAWPVQGRYQYPAIPFVLAGATVSVLELLRRMGGFWRPASIDKESAA